MPRYEEIRGWVHDRFTISAPFYLPRVPCNPGMEVWALAYEVTARKWRPQEFDGVIGQEHVTTTLKNAIQAGQIAHAYLFAGPRGVGKTTTARILAKALNCVNGPTVTPCNACTFCHEIAEGRSVDVLEIDGASNNRVEQVRNHLLESVKYTPSKGKHKIYIIDEVHMLTKEAFNALLKTLEEPPPHVYFIFATTDPRKVIPTVLSRCQRFDFRRISGPVIVDHLAMISEKSGYGIQRDALALVARRVDGSLRDAESLMDQIVAFGGTGLTAREAAEVLGIVDQDVYFELLDIVADQDVSRGLDLVDRLFRQGHDLDEIILGVLEHLRNLLVVKASPDAEALLGAAALELDRYRKQAEGFEAEDLLRLSQLATQMEQSVKHSALPRVQLETGIVRMVRMVQSVQLTEVMSRLSEMAQRVGGGEGDGGPTDSDFAGESKPPDARRESSSASEQPVERGATAAEPGSSTGTAQVKPSDTNQVTSSDAKQVMSSGKTPGSLTDKVSASLTDSETGERAETSGAATTAVEIDVSEIRNRWSGIVEEVRVKSNSLGSFLDEAKITGFSPAEDAGSGRRAVIKLGFNAKDQFHKEKVEKRDAAMLIQTACSSVLGIPIRIVCEIDDKTEAVEKTGGDETTVMEEEQAPSTDKEEQTPSTGKEVKQEAGARSAVAKDPAVMKIVEAFDGKIVAD